VHQVRAVSGLETAEVTQKKIFALLRHDRHEIEGTQRMKAPIIVKLAH
jgi:hypothetical protein